MKSSSWQNSLLKFNPCIEAIIWMKSQNSIKKAWDNCHRGDWMLWFACHLSIDMHILTLASGFGRHLISKKELEIIVSIAANATPSAKIKNQQQTANICRRILTKKVFKAIKLINQK